jgi:hypothetical protein
MNIYCVNGAQLHTFHQDLHLTAPHYHYIHFTSHHVLISFPLPHLADLHPTQIPSTSRHFTYHFPTPALGNTRFPPYFKIPSLHFTSHHLSHFSPLSWKHSISSSLRILFTSLLFTYPFPTPVLGNTQFPPTKNPFSSLHLTSLHLSLSNPCSWKYSISSVLQNPFTSLHFTSLHLSHFSLLS